MKLRFKILILCLGCTLLALLLQTVLFQDTSSELIYNLSKEESETSLQNMQKEIYAYIKNMESKFIEIYSEQELIECMKTGYNSYQLRKNFYRKAYDIATNTFETDDGVVALYIYTPDHKIISTYRRAMTPKHNYEADIYENPEGYNTGIIMNYVESDNQTMLVSSYYNQYREKDILRFVLKLYYDSNRDEKIGYVVCDVDSKVFSSIIEKYCSDNTMYIWLQPNGDRPSVAVGSLTKAEKSYCDDIQNQIAGGGETVENNVPQQELFQVGQTTYNLTAYSLMPQHLLHQNQEALRNNLILIAGLMLIFAAILSFLVSRSVTRPLDMLMKTIQRIKEGNTKLRSEVKNRDEIGELGQNFNEMLDQMEELAEKENKANLLLSQAQYKALQAQINPHFLYNTLETMSSIAEIKNCPEVSMISHSLSSIFRYSLNMKEPFATIAQELNHLRNYSYVMAMRMQDHVNYIYDIDKDVLQDKIPRLTIQPLVENALNHGLRNVRGTKEVRIGIENLGNLLRICVADNGVGMEVDEINENLKNNDLKYVEKGNSIGIYNINARLKMLHGDTYGLWIESTVGEGTQVYMTIPREGGKDDKANK